MPRGLSVKAPTFQEYLLPLSGYMSEGPHLSRKRT